MLELKSLTAGYSEPVVHGVSFTLREGELAALLGRNGSGKTTLLRAITGSARRFGGEALVFGEDCAAIDGEKCIACFRCVKNCPVQAKGVFTPEYQSFAAAFSEKLKELKENQYFLGRG